jgi:glyoxylase-like metal-dependent hydrolase (beta-lactamase superfamily II)
VSLTRDVAPGIHRVEDNFTNWYLVEDGGRLTVVDAGITTSWGSLRKALTELGRKTDDLDAVVLTHAHFDHIGFAERARSELGLTIWCPREDVHLTRHPRAYARERTPLYYVLTKPRALPIVAGFIATRGLWPTPVEEVTPFDPGDAVPLPAGGRVVATPGHTFGHTAFHFPDRDALIAGDAIVTLDPYTARKGPRLVARAATADTERNLRSLDALIETGARTVLVGHGDPWTDGIESAVVKARQAGSA